MSYNRFRSGFSKTTLGQCDRSKIITQLDRLIDQDMIVGNQRVKTGYKVLPYYYDEPNPQSGLTLPVIPDPVPVTNPRIAPYLLSYSTYVPPHPAPGFVI